MFPAIYRNKRNSPGNSIPPDLDSIIRLKIDYVQYLYLYSVEGYAT